MNPQTGFIASVFSSSDEQAMARLQTRNDHHAFAQLVRRWEQPIVRLCAKMTGDSWRAEDLKQEAFARVFTKRGEFVPGMRFSTWLWRIALNLCYDELRKVHRRGESSLEIVHEESRGAGADLAAEESAPDGNAVAAEESELVRRALLRLPETLRSVLVLRFCEELKLREIGEILALPESTVRYRLAEGLTQITRLLEPTFGRPNGSAASRVRTPEITELK
jgi:RNA polymerase sigma-70 factor (ECF subfamily)